MAVCDSHSQISFGWREVLHPSSPLFRIFAEKTKQEQTQPFQLRELCLEKVVQLLVDKQRRLELWMLPSELKDAIKMRLNQKGVFSHFFPLFLSPLHIELNFAGKNENQILQWKNVEQLSSICPRLEYLNLESTHFLPSPESSFLWRLLLYLWNLLLWLLGFSSTKFKSLRSLNLSNSSMSDSQLSFLLQNSPFLEDFSADWCIPLKPSALFPLLHFSRLRRLSLKFCLQIDDFFLCSLVQANPPLLFLDLEGLSWIQSSTWQLIFATWPHLIHLNLSGCTPLGDQEIHQIPVLEMRELNLSRTDLTCFGLARPLSQMKKLEKLSLNGCVLFQIDSLIPLLSSSLSVLAIKKIASPLSSSTISKIIQFSPFLISFEFSSSEKIQNLCFSLSKSQKIQRLLIHNSFIVEKNPNHIFLAPLSLSSLNYLIFENYFELASQSEEIFRIAKNRNLTHFCLEINFNLVLSFPLK